jgi:hypothetical protein
MMNVTKGRVLCYSPEMLELRDLLRSYFSEDRLQICGETNNVNAFYIHIESCNIQKLASKLALQGHKMEPSDLAGIYCLQLKSGAKFHVIVSEKFSVLVTL